jgi:hypothetical protein
VAPTVSSENLARNLRFASRRVDRAMSVPHSLAQPAFVNFPDSQYSVEYSRLSMSVSPSGPSGNSANADVLSSFIEIAKKYKELIGLFVAAISGLTFAVAYFATKQQLSDFKCLVNANMDLIQGKMDSTSLSQLMQQNLVESAELEGKTGLSSSEMIKRNQLKAAAGEIARKLAEADNFTAKALNKIRSGECSTN